MNFFAIAGAMLFGVLAVLTALVTVGLPLGEFTLGGKYRVLPPKMRIMSGVSFVIQLIAIISVLSVSGIIVTPLSFKVSKGICIFFAVYLLINTGMNFISESKKEKIVMTPLSLIASICFFITAFTS